MHGPLNVKKVLKGLGLPDPNTKATQFFEMSVTTHVTKQCHITQALKFSCNSVFCAVLYNFA